MGKGACCDWDIDGGVLMGSVWQPREIYRHCVITRSEKRAARQQVVLPLSSAEGVGLSISTQSPVPLYLVLVGFWTKQRKKQPLLLLVHQRVFTYSSILYAYIIRLAMKLTRLCRTSTRHRARIFGYTMQLQFMGSFQNKCTLHPPSTSISLVGFGYSWFLS
jgi:hypothetical protein